MQTAFLSRKEIAPGICLSTIPSTVYKTNYLQFHFFVPLTKECAAKTAILSHLITFACARYPDIKEMRRAQSALYNAQVSAQVKALGETQVFTLSASFLKDRYALNQENVTAELIGFIRDLLRDPLLENGGFSESFCALASKNAVADALATLNDKSLYARRRLIEIMYRGDAFSIDPLGEPERLRAYDAKDLYAFFEEILRTARVEVLFAGEADEETLVRSVGGCFSALDRAPQKGIPCVPKIARDPVQSVSETMEINQAHLLFGMTTPLTRTHPGFFAFQAANMVFGATPSSKLFLNVREKLSLCYRVHSIFDATKGFLTIYAGIEAQNRKKAEDEISKQFALMKEGAFSPEDLDLAKSMLLNAYRSYTESPESAISWALPRIFCDLPVDPESEMRAIEAVTKDDAVHAFSTLKPDTVYFLYGGAQ